MSSGGRWVLPEKSRLVDLCPLRRNHNRDERVPVTMAGMCKVPLICLLDRRGGVSMRASWGCVQVEWRNMTGNFKYKQDQNLAAKARLHVTMQLFLFPQTSTYSMVSMSSSFAHWMPIVASSGHSLLYNLLSSEKGQEAKCHSHYLESLWGTIASSEGSLCSPFEAVEFLVFVWKSKIKRSFWRSTALTFRGEAGFCVTRISLCSQVSFLWKA